MRSVLSGGFWGLFLAGLGLGFASEVSEPPFVTARDAAAVTDVATAPAQTAALDPQDASDDTMAEAEAMQEDLAAAPQTAPEAADQVAGTIAEDPPNATAEVAVPVPAGVATTETETQEAAAEAGTSEATTGSDTQVAAQDADAPAVTAQTPTDANVPDAIVANKAETDGNEDADGATGNTVAEVETLVTEEAPVVANTTPPTVSTATSDVPAPEVGNQNPPAVTENLADFIDRMVMPDGSAPPTAPELDPNLLTKPAPRAPLAVVDGGTPDAPIPDMTEVDVPTAEVADAPIPAPARVADVSNADDLPTTEVTSAEQPAAPQQTTVTVNKPVVSEETDSTEGADTQVAAAAPATNAVRINRPTAQTEEVPTPTEGADEAASEEIATDAPAHLRYAAPFDNPNDLPLMSIVLLDDGTVPGIFDMITDIGFPATVVLDAGAALVGTRMTAYRAGGVELGLQADLPENPTPSDVEVTLEAAFGAVPEAVALFVDERDGGKASRDVSSQVMQILADKGRGFVSFQEGLGNSVRDAAQANVPAAAVARDLDESVAAPSDLNRILDQAAFNARQSGKNVLVARITPELLTGLKAWADKLDRDQLLLAPVSAMFSEVDAAQ